MPNSRYFLLLCLLLPAAWTGAAEFRLLGGYSTFNLSEVNRALEKNKAAVATVLGNQTISLKPVTDGFFAGFDLAFNVLPNLKVMPRFEFLQASSGNFGYQSGTYTAKTYYNARAVEILLGVEAEAWSNNWFALDGGLWAGWANATWEAQNRTETGGSKVDHYTGETFAAELGGTARLKMGRTWFCGFNLAWRYAPFGVLKDQKGMPLISGGEAVSFDFGGFNAGGELGFRWSLPDSSYAKASKNKKR